MKRLVLLSIFCCVTAIFAAAPKYVFLFIGDGMSIPQRMVTEDYLNKTSGKQVVFNHFPCNASTRTSCANQFVTDSAASGTAIACGEKTNYKYLGVATDGVRHLESSAYVAQKKGMKVGIITSVTINHATPGAFYAHRKDRGQYYEIGLDMLASGFDYFAGGAMTNADDKKCAAYKGDLYELAKPAGYHFAEIQSSDDLAKITSANGKVWLCGSKSGNLPYEIDTPQAQVHLKDYVAKGIELLDNPNGFFMMCEGGAIDYGGHANDPGFVLHEAMALNNAVAVALDFAKKHEGETLIVVTGDHETGGLSIGFANTGIIGKVEFLTYQKCTAAALARKIRDAVNANPKCSFADIQPVITENFGLKFAGDINDPMLLKPYEISHLAATFASQYQPGAGKKSSGRLDLLILNAFSKRCGLVYTTGGHSAIPVITSAYGVGAENFSGARIGMPVDYACKTALVDKMTLQGEYENSDVSLKLKALLK